MTSVATEHFATHPQPRKMKGEALSLEHVRTVLMIQLGDIGDVVYSFPCARALKGKMPGARLIWAVRNKAAGLLEGCRWADGIIVIEERRLQGETLGVFRHQWEFWRKVREYRFDLAVDLRTGSRGAILAFLSGAPLRLAPYALDGKLWRNRLFTHLVMPSGKQQQYIVEHYIEPLMTFGISTDKVLPEVGVDPERLGEAHRLLVRNRVSRERRVVAVQPFSLWSYKEWKKEKMAALIRRIHEDYDLSILVVGGPDEEERAGEIVALAGEGVFNLAGQTSIALLPAVLKGCALFLGVDSAGLHIAAAVGTPVVGLYGPSSFATWAPRGEKHIVVHQDYSCVPCNRKGCNDSLVSRCMETLGVDTVYSAVRTQLA